MNGYIHRFQSGHSCSHLPKLRVRTSFIHRPGNWDKDLTGTKH